MCGGGSQAAANWLTGRGHTDTEEVVEVLWGRVVSPGDIHDEGPDWWVEMIAEELALTDEQERMLADAMNGVQLVVSTPLDPVVCVCAWLNSLSAALVTLTLSTMTTATPPATTTQAATATSDKTALAHHFHRNGCRLATGALRESFCGFFLAPPPPHTHTFPGSSFLCRFIPVAALVLD